MSVEMLGKQHDSASTEKEADLKDYIVRKIEFNLDIIFTEFRRSCISYNYVLKSS